MKSKEEIVRMKEMWRDGKYVTEIGRTLKIDRRTVFSHLKELISNQTILCFSCNTEIKCKTRRKFCSIECFNRIKVQCTNCDEIRYLTYSGFDNILRGVSSNRCLKCSKLNHQVDEETRRKISKTKTGTKLSKTHKKNIGLGNFGKKLSEETKRKMGQSRKGEKHYLFGRHHTEKTKKKMSLAQSGQNSYLWIDGRSKFVPPGRYGSSYLWKKIRKEVLERDNHVCQRCGITVEEYGKSLDIHHIIPFLYSLDNSLENLTTLCKRCHTKTEAEVDKKFKETINLEVFPLAS